jgi:hypothetical protein
MEDATNAKIAALKNKAIQSYGRNLKRCLTAKRRARIIRSIWLEE